jgi:tetratricopeptide (TPR) repeat protein
MLPTFRGRRPTWLAVVVLVLSTFLGLPADAAKPPREAKAYADRGIQAYNLGRFTDAIAEFEKAYELDPAPVFLFNIAQSHRQSGNTERAAFFYRRFLRAAPVDHADRLSAEKHLRAIEESGKQVTPRSTDAPTAPKEPGPEKAPPPREVTPDLRAQPRPSPIPSPDSGGARPTEPPSPKPAVSSGSSWRRRGAWATGGVALLSLGLGVVFQVSASGAASDFNLSCAVFDDGIDAEPGATPARSRTECLGLYDDWKSDRRIATALLVGGGVFAVASTVLFMTSRSAAHAEPTHASVRCLPSGAGLVCQGVF